MTNFSYGANMQYVVNGALLSVVSTIIETMRVSQMMKDELAKEIEEQLAKVETISKEDLINLLTSELASKDFVRAEFEKLRSKITEVKSELKQEIAAVKSELKQEIAEVKAELKQDIAEVRQEIAEVKSELKQEIAEVKSELKQEIAEVKAELKQEIAEVKAELKQDIAEVRQEIAEVKSELKQEIAEVKVELKQDISNLRTEIHKNDKKTTIFLVIITLTLIFTNAEVKDALSVIKGWF